MTWALALCPGCTTTGRAGVRAACAVLVLLMLYVLLV
jgi:hypothetical protein